MFGANFYCALPIAFKLISLRWVTIAMIRPRLC